MKISNHFLESSQKLSSHLKNQEHYTNVTSSRPTKPQSEWINLMHGDQSLKTLKFQQQRAVKGHADNLQAIIQYKAQICFGKSTKDNHWSDQREDVRVQNKEARRILIELEPAQGLGQYAINLTYIEEDASTTTKKQSTRRQYRYTTRKVFLEDDKASDDSILLWTRMVI
ncbi:hypothetical protein Tco_1102336 [Tanacetum coccineum]